MDRRKDNLYIASKASPTTIYKDCNSRHALDCGDGDKYVIDQKQRINEYLNGIEEASKNRDEQPHSSHSRRQELKRLICKEDAGDYYSLKSSQTSVGKEPEKKNSKGTSQSSKKSSYKNIPSLKALIAEAVQLADEQMNSASGSYRSHKSRTSVKSESDYIKSASTLSSSHGRSLSPKSSKSTFTVKPESLTESSRANSSKSRDSKKSKDMNPNRAEMLKIRQKYDMRTMKSLYSASGCISDDLRRLVFIQLEQDRIQDHISSKCRAMYNKTEKQAETNAGSKAASETEHTEGHEEEPEETANDAADVLQVTAEELIINRAVKPVVNELHRMCLNNVSQELLVLNELEELPKKIHDALKGFNIFGTK